MHLTRRSFLAATSATLLSTRLRAQTAHINVAAFERERILAIAPAALATPISPKLSELSPTIATLTAAFLLTQEPAYAQRAALHLATLPTLDPHPSAPVTDLIPLAEVAVALRFLTDTLPPEILTAIYTFLATLQTFMETDRAMIIQRDVHDHRASAHLLIASAIARSQPVSDPLGSKALESCRARLRKPTLRNQITADGHFPQELATPYPFRNTLFNFDLLAGACQLLASPFEKLWDFELPDGPGLRSATAFVVPFIEDPTKWISVADADHFRDLPGRRNGLLFAGRAYNRPEYVDLWKSLPTFIPPPLADTFPIREPLLWIAKAPHGL
jgi:hypothetical protein